MSTGRATTALLCPGQGSQFAGMGREIATLPGGTALVQEASARSGLPLTDLLLRGRDQEIARPAVAQVAVFCYSVAALTGWRRTTAGPVVTAGHSVGEYAAMVAAGMLDTETALGLVIERGRLMQRDADRHGGTMAAVVGLAADRVQELCRESSAQPVVIANHNSSRQVVVSGVEAGVKQVMEQALAAGAVRVKQLSVGGAYHSPLMSEAEAGMAELWAGVRVADPVPGCTLVSSCTGAVVTDAEAHRRTMQGHLTGPVLWHPTMTAVADLQPEVAVELGPGRVLRGLARDVAPGLPFEDATRVAARAARQRVAGEVLR